MIYNTLDDTEYLTKFSKIRKAILNRYLSLDISQEDAINYSCNDWLIIAKNKKFIEDQLENTTKLEDLALKLFELRKTINNYKNLFSEIYKETAPILNYLNEFSSDDFNILTDIFKFWLSGHINSRIDFDLLLYRYLPEDTELISKLNKIGINFFGPSDISSSSCAIFDNVNSTCKFTLYRFNKKEIALWYSEIYKILEDVNYRKGRQLILADFEFIVNTTIVESLKEKGCHIFETSSELVEFLKTELNCKKDRCYPLFFCRE